MAKSKIPQVATLEDGDTLTKPILFISEYRGLRVWEAGQKKPVCTFTPFALMHPTYGQISKGHYLCKSKKVFEYLIEDGHGLDKSYRIVKKLPRETDRKGNVIITHRDNDTRKELHELNDEERLLYRELVEKEARYFTKESNYTVFKDNIKSEETKNRIERRMSAIRNTLNLKD